MTRDMEILSATGGMVSTNAFLIADPDSGEAVLFDAPDHTVGALLDEAQKRHWKVVGLWLTHGHFDHIADHAEVTRRFPEARVLIHKLDEPKLQKPSSRIPLGNLVIPPRSADAHVEDGRTLTIGSIPVEVIHTPGHSPGHVSYHFPDQHVLVGGDLIIMGAVGRTDLPDASPSQLNESIRRIMTLDGQTQLLPGHGHPSRLEDERRNNPFVIEALRGS